MVTIAVDAMGGDHSPKSEVEGAVQAARTLGVAVILVGREEVVRRELVCHDGWADLPIRVVHASERVTMDDSGLVYAIEINRNGAHRVLGAAPERWVRPEYHASGYDDPKPGEVRRVRL